MLHPFNSCDVDDLPYDMTTITGQCLYWQYIIRRLEIGKQHQICDRDCLVKTVYESCPEISYESCTLIGEFVMNYDIHHYNSNRYGLNWNMSQNILSMNQELELLDDALWDVLLRITWCKFKKYALGLRYIDDIDDDPDQSDNIRWNLVYVILLHLVDYQHIIRQFDVSLQTGNGDEITCNWSCDLCRVLKEQNDDGFLHNLWSKIGGASFHEINGL